MHSTKRTRTKRITLGTLLIGALAFASAAEAGERQHARHADQRDRMHVGRGDSVRDTRHGATRIAARAGLHDARRTARRLERRGDVLDHQLDFLALVAAVSGEHRLAHELDRVGDRIERRYDRRGDRVLRHARQQLRHADRGKYDRRGRKHARHGWKRQNDRHRHSHGCGHADRDRHGVRIDHHDVLSLHGRRWNR